MSTDVLLFILLSALMFTAVVHFLAAGVAAWDRGTGWQIWVIVLSAIGGLQSLMAWSYTGMLYGDRDPMDHFELVLIAASPLAAWPGALILALIVLTRKDADQMHSIGSIIHDILVNDDDDEDK